MRVRDGVNRQVEEVEGEAAHGYRAEPRTENHSLGCATGHFETQRIDDGVETIYAYRHEHVHVGTRNNVADETYDFAHGLPNKPLIGYYPCCYKWKTNQNHR